jgi:nitrate reductase NapA
MDPMFVHDDFKKKFKKTMPTDRKFYFYMDKKGEGKANIFLRPYDGPGEVPDKDYPFYLTTGRVIEHWHTGTMTMRIPEIQRAHPNAYIEIHPEDANNLNIMAGDMVEVESRRGKCILPAVVTKTSMPGILFVPWFDQAYDRLINFVVSDVFDPGSKEPEFKISAVKIKKASGPKNVAEKYVINDVNSKFGQL